MSDLRRTDDARGEIRFHRGGVMRTAFACESCEAVMMLTGRVSPAEAEDQRAA